MHCWPLNFISRKQRIAKSKYGDHNLLIYNDLTDFRKIYTYHSKESLEKNNEIVLLASTYETPDKVRNNLESAGVNIQKHMQDGSLMVIDSMRGYHMSDVYGVVKLVETLQVRGQSEGKSGVLCFADIGTFFLLDKIQKLVDYELTVPKKLDMKVKAFCCYHKGNFDFFTKQQKQNLLAAHRVV